MLSTSAIALNRRSVIRTTSFSIEATRNVERIWRTSDITSRLRLSISKPAYDTALTSACRCRSMSSLLYVPVRTPRPSPSSCGKSTSVNIAGSRKERVNENAWGRETVGSDGS